MLYSTESSVHGKRPAFMAWLGNFFEPYFSDTAAVDAALLDLRSLGINSIVLDSKLWSDFTRYFRTGETSQYVSMQLYISGRCREYGLGVSFLALFAIGDNLHPEIYDHPPEFVEQPVDFWGKPFRGYRHWSSRQMDEHVRHCLDLYRHIARDAAATALDEAGRERLPFYFYHSPIFAPSFDADGRSVYLDWLRARYSLDELNARYGTAHSSFEDLTPADYWVRPDFPDEVGRYLPATADYAERSAVVRKYADNQCFKQEVMKRYFREVVDRLRAAEPRFYFYAALSQWKYFFNDFVHIQNRGWDLWDLGEVLDSPSFITMPVDNRGGVEPYVVPCELAMLRSAAQDRDFVGSLFLGRYMANDVYAVCSPAEVIASAFGSGATDLYFYGYNGLDDGGNFGKWGEAEKTSLRLALDWFATVRELAGSRVRAREAAIVFPYASYSLSAFATDAERYVAFREDLLGWYRQFSDHGLSPDILHPRQVAAGELTGYKYVVVPADPHYWALPNPAMEEKLRAFVKSGGVLLHGGSGCVHQAFDIAVTPHRADSFAWEEKIVTASPEFVAYRDGDVRAKYLSDNAPAYVIRRVGDGEVHSFGFHYGCAYGSREHLPVPREYKKENHYPLTIAARTPVDKILVEAGHSRGRHRGIENIDFQNGALFINHTPYTLALPSPCPQAFSTYEGFEGRFLPGRHAVFVPR